MDKRKTTDKNELSLEDYHLKTNKVIDVFNVKQVGTARTIGKNNFTALESNTCYVVEVWEECMRLPHWHPNASELGYVISGTIEVLIWRSPGESAVLTLGPGMCWFIPKAALHSLNNVGKGTAKLLVGFSNEQPQDIDLPVAFNGIPLPIRDAYTSPHAELRKWKGVTSNPLLGRCPVQPALHSVLTASPYGFDLAKVTPLFDDTELGSVIWGIKDNWSILKEISILRAILKPGVARDPIWYPDAGTLYVVAKGKGEFNLIIANHEPSPFQVDVYDYIYVPTGVLHTFSNRSSSQDLEIIAFFTQEDPQPEVSFSVATAFFPNEVRKAALTQYSNEHKSGDPLKHLNYTETSPYLLKITETERMQKMTRSREKEKNSHAV